MTICWNARGEVQETEGEDSGDIQKEYAEGETVPWYAPGPLGFHPVLLQEGRDNL